jgi:hypothetical protein
MHTMNLYVTTAINGAVFGVILAFCVILGATRNWIMALAGKMKEPLESR